ncbi:unnamed protein product [Gadus morhua 'NCC']
MLPADCRVKIKMDDYGVWSSFGVSGLDFLRCTGCQLDLERGAIGFQGGPTVYMAPPNTSYIRAPPTTAQMNQSHVPDPLPPLAKAFQPPCLPDPCPLSQSSSRNPSPSLPTPPDNVSAPKVYSLAGTPLHEPGPLPLPCPASLDSQQLGPQPRPSLSPCPPPGLTLVGPSHPQALLPSPP